MVLAGLIAGIFAGAILLLLAHIAPYIGAGNYVSDIGRVSVLGQQITEREGQIMGILVHLMTSAGFGAIYAELVQHQYSPDFTFLGIMSWCLFITIVVAVIILPISGKGFFGVKEDPWFSIDLFITNVGWGVLYWFLVPLWLKILI